LSSRFFGVLPETKRWHRDYQSRTLTNWANFTSSRINNTVLRYVIVAPLGMFLLVYLFDTYLLIFDGHASWSQSLGICFMVGLRYYWVSRLGKIRNIFLCHGVFIDVENALLVLYCTQSLACVTCFSQQSQDVRMNHFFCVYAFLCYSSVPIPMPAIYSCRAIRQHVLCFSDCPTSFSSQFLTLSLLLMVHASTLSTILYSAAAAGNLMCASSRSSTHESSDFKSLVSDAWLAAHLLLLQLLRVHRLVLMIRLVLWCGLLSFREDRLWPSTREESRQTKSLILRVRYYFVSLRCG